MPTGIGTNMRVTANSRQGGRKYMEDYIAVVYQEREDKKALEFAFFGIFDGHGGREAAEFAKKHLMNNIVDDSDFWSNDDQSILKAIKGGFTTTHNAMWKQQASWPRSSSGFPSTAGTTASVCFIKNGKIYIGHVGDSAIVLGERLESADHFTGSMVTTEHKPDAPQEKERIESIGGAVEAKSGVQRVVWHRPKSNHRGPIRRSTALDKIPFLAVARSLGDLWSYDYIRGEFAVSPEPDLHVLKIDHSRHRCLILASDGLWNMLSPQDAVDTVERAERLEEEQHWQKAKGKLIALQNINPSYMLVEQALDRWRKRNFRADNTSCITVLLDPQGPSRSTVLQRHLNLQRLRPRIGAHSTTHLVLTSPRPDKPPTLPLQRSAPRMGTSSLFSAHRKRSRCCNHFRSGSECGCSATNLIGASPGFVPSCGKRKKLDPSLDSILPSPPPIPPTSSKNEKTLTPTKYRISPAGKADSKPSTSKQPKWSPFKSTFSKIEKDEYDNPIKIIIPTKYKHLFAQSSPDSQAAKEANNATCNVVVTPEENEKNETPKADCDSAPLIDLDTAAFVEVSSSDDEHVNVEEAVSNNENVNGRGSADDCLTSLKAVVQDDKPEMDCPAKKMVRSKSLSCAAEARKPECRRMILRHKSVTMNHVVSRISTYVLRSKNPDVLLPVKTRKRAFAAHNSEDKKPADSASDRTQRKAQKRKSRNSIAGAEPPRKVTLTDSTGKPSKLSKRQSLLNLTKQKLRNIANSTRHKYSIGVH